MMYTREQHVNIPIEILRTVVTIVECGSFTKAGERLGLSQPGISAQIKKLQLLVGGAVFERTPNGVALTEKGKLLLPLTRKLLEANDQILNLGGSAKDPRPTRLGICDFYAEPFLKVLPREKQKGLQIHCDQSDEIAKGLTDGYFDVGCLLAPAKDLGHFIEKWEEDLIWVRSRDFVSSPGSPIPIVGWPGFLHDRISLETLQAAGVAYRIAFESCDHHIRMSAVASGVGVMALPRRALNETVVVAKEYYLPPLPKVEGGVCVRQGFEGRKTAELRAIFAEFASPQLAGLASIA